MTHSLHQIKYLWNRKSPLLAMALLSLVVFSLFSLFCPPIPPDQTNSSISMKPQEQVASGTAVKRIDTEGKNPLGEIRMHSLLEMPQGDFGPTETIQSLFDNHLNASMEYVNGKPFVLISTVKPATVETKTTFGASDIYNMTIRLNETVVWKYNNTISHFVIGYRPKMQMATLVNMFLNGTLLNPTQYFVNTSYVDGEEGNNFFYDFTAQYNTNPNGTLRITYQYDTDIIVNAWRLSSPAVKNYLNSSEQTFAQKYDLNISIGNPNKQMNLTADFNVTLPDVNYIFNVSYNSFEGRTPREFLEYLLRNKIYTLKNVNLTSPRSIDFSFNANFTVKVLDATDQFWCEDRLIRHLNVRERDYKISIINGPPTLFFTQFSINETGIYYPEFTAQGRVVRSALGRSVVVENMNKSTGRKGNITYYDGINIDLGSGYYLVTGEVDLITVRYDASRILSMIITDSISTPLSGYKVQVFLAQKPFGSRVSIYDPVPFPTLTTDTNGQVAIHHVPTGNFTVQILDPSGKIIENQTVSSLMTVNSVHTSVVHFPTVILVYSGVFAAILMIGIVIYRKNLPKSAK